MLRKPVSAPALITTFLLLAYGISWSFWIPAALLNQNVSLFPGVLLLFLGGFGPSLAGIIMVYRTKDLAERLDFWRRTVDIRQIGVRVLLGILTLFPLVGLGATAISLLVGGPPHDYAALQQAAAKPGLLAIMLLGGLISGPVSEELGWRGFALDILNNRLKPFLATIMLGLFWSVWHLPLFFIQGTTQQGLGINTLNFWLFVINPIPLSALFARVYYQTGRSILSSILMHLSFNFTAGLLYPLSPQAGFIQTGLLMVLMALALADLSHRQYRLPARYAGKGTNPG
ncbi:MAG TPA: type II CAAX endopeptidase family protein [Anaerolineaceae bacterium]|nr:type II CAAX endopeptidase family protein [Anaerolineaceae bacterium]